MVKHKPNTKVTPQEPHKCIFRMNLYRTSNKMFESFKSKFPTRQSDVEMPWIYYAIHYYFNDPRFAQRHFWQIIVCWRHYNSKTVNSYFNRYRLRKTARFQGNKELLLKHASPLPFSVENN